MFGHTVWPYSNMTILFGGGRAERGVERNEETEEDANLLLLTVQYEYTLSGRLAGLVVAGRGCETAKAATKFLQEFLSGSAIQRTPIIIRTHPPSKSHFSARSDRLTSSLDSWHSRSAKKKTFPSDPCTSMMPSSRQQQPHQHPHQHRNRTHDEIEGPQQTLPVPLLGGWHFRRKLSSSEGGAGPHPPSDVRILHLQGCTPTKSDVTLLAACLSDPSCPFHELALHEVDLGTDGFVTVLRAVAQNQSLRVLDVCDVHATTSTSSSINTSAGGSGRTVAARHLRDALRAHPRLRVLRLGDLRFGGEDGDDGSGDDSRALADGLSASPALEELDLFYCRGLCWEKLAPAFVRLRTLRLPLSCFGMGPNRLSRVLLVHHAPSATSAAARIDDDNPNHDHHAEESESAHPSLPPPPAAVPPPSIGLIELDLSNNRFGNNEASALATFVKCSQSLQALALDRNGIEDVGAAQLLDATIQHPALMDLGLSGNNLTPTTLVELSKLLPHMALTRLALGCIAEEHGGGTTAEVGGPMPQRRRRDPRVVDVVPALLEGLRSNGTLLELELEDRRGKLRLPPTVEYYLCRNRLRPWLLHHDNDGPGGLATLPWPVALHSLSHNRQASVVYHVMREKLPSWVACPGRV